VSADAIRYVRVGDALTVQADAVRFVPNNAESLLYVHADRLGTAQRITDQAGAVVWDAVYLPFGTAHSITGSVTYNQRFPGQYFDAETGLHYNYWRDYDPRVGRYLQADPIGLAGGVNRYAYGNANPLSYVDSDGTIANWIVGAGAGAIIAGGGNLAWQLYQNDWQFECVNWSEIGAWTAAGALVGATGGAAGPKGPLFGRGRYRGGKPGLFNKGDPRMGWSWNQGGWAGPRNYFGPHGGTPGTPGHWHRTPIPGPRGPGW